MPPSSDREHTTRIFLCHASEDKPRVAELYQQLKAAGYHPWLDKEDLLPGQNWRREIRKIITAPYNLVLVCLSNNSITKRGIVQQEIRWALDILDQMPEDAIYLIPVRLEECKVPERFANLQWVNWFELDSFEYLKRALDLEIRQRTRASEAESVALLKPTTPPKILSPSHPFEPELILIPAGEFMIGSDPKVDKNARDREQPQHRLHLSDYYIAKTPVTNAQYAAFVKATGHRQPNHWNNGQPPADKMDHPVVCVGWLDAVAYCQWLANATDKLYRLPTEAEWEKAARGPDGRIYPWGNTWDPERCNTREGGPGGTTLVGQYSPQGDGPYGVLDMAGNVWEWCVTKWGKSYPYDVGEIEWTEEYLKGTDCRVVRGGSWGYPTEYARCAYRDWGGDYGRNAHFGYRVQCSLIQ